MSITLDLPPEIEDALVADATERGMPVEELAAHAMQLFIFYSAPFEKFIQQMGQLDNSAVETPTGGDKTDVSLQWLTAMHDMGKEQAEFQMSVLHAAVALRKASDDLQTLPEPDYLKQLSAFFSELPAYKSGVKFKDENSASTVPLWTDAKTGGVVEEAKLADITDIKERPKHISPNRGFGFLKGRISGSDAFLEDKHAEVQREREKDEARQYGVRKTSS